MAMGIITPTSQLAFERGTAPLFQILTRHQLRQIVDFRADRTIQERVELLAGKCNRGELTDDERAQYEGYARANRFVAIMQGMARRLLGS